MHPLPPSPSPSDSDLVNTYRRTFKQCTYERKLGSNELSYYLPSRAEGVNDMCVLELGDLTLRLFTR